MMTSSPVVIPQPGPEGEGCRQCGEPLRSDQRYCLNCGHRRAQTRLAFLEVFGPHGPGARPSAATDATAPLPVAPPAALERSPLVALGLLLALLLALGIGVVIGRGARGQEVAARAPVVNVAAAPAAGTATAPAPVVSDWPAAKQGWTIQLSALASTATDAEVAKAKQDATSAGAPAVGALRSDDYASLPAGQLVVYSGEFASRSAARKALKPLRTSFPAAKVVRISTTAPAAGATRANGAADGATPVPKSRSDLSPQEYQKKSKKLPDEVQSEGAPPPEDGKAPGGGTGEATEIG